MAQHTQPGTAVGRRSAELQPSDLHEVHLLARHHPADVIALHVGEPDITMPSQAVEAYHEALCAGHTTYTHAAGLPELRQRLADLHHAQPPIEHVFVGPGSCQLLCAIFQSLAVPAGTVIMPRIHWPMHLQQIQLAGLTPRFVDLTTDEHTITAALDAAFDKSVVALLINSPANPSGHVLTTAQQHAIYDWACRRNVKLISDEAYESFIFDGDPLIISELDATQPITQRLVFSVHTFSKGYSMTGCRLGYVIAPTPSEAELLTRVQEATLVAPAMPTQYAGLGALDAPQHLDLHHAYVQETRAAILPILNQLDILPAPHQGGWYALLDLGAYCTDTYDLALRMLEDIHVAMAPGRGLVPPNDPLAHRLARITLCAQRDSTIDGVQRLADYLNAR